VTVVLDLFAVVRAGLGIDALGATTLTVLGRLGVVLDERERDVL